MGKFPFSPFGGNYKEQRFQEQSEGEVQSEYDFDSRYQDDIKNRSPSKSTVEILVPYGFINAASVAMSNSEIVMKWLRNFGSVQELPLNASEEPLFYSRNRPLRKITCRRFLAVMESIQIIAIGGPASKTLSLSPTQPLLIEGNFPMSTRLEDPTRERSVDGFFIKPPFLRSETNVFVTDQKTSPSAESPGFTIGPIPNLLFESTGYELGQLGWWYGSPNYTAMISAMTNSVTADPSTAPTTSMNAQFAMEFIVIETQNSQRSIGSK